MQSYYDLTFKKIGFPNETEASLVEMAVNIQKSKHNYAANKAELDNWLISEYIREVWISETPPNKNLNTIEIVDGLVEGGPKPADLDQDEWQKLTNLKTAFDDIFSGNDFTVDFAKHIHQIVGYNLFENAGEYRTKRVMAQGSHVMYATPASIPARLEGLFQFVAAGVAVKIEDPQAKILYMVRLGAFFFSEFLLIHPFSDGNGRTARLLLNALLAETVIIPFSLFHESRQKFIEVLEKRNDHSPPSDLARFILLACNKTASDINWQALV